MNAPTTKFIHLLYAPTNFCNMACQYCYLGYGTDIAADTGMAVTTLEQMVSRCLTEAVVPYNLSFHGGEPTAVPKKVLAALLGFAQRYFLEHGQAILSAGFPLNPVHIKTNLYNFDKLLDLFEQYEVSVSGSVDLPLEMHARFRTNKHGESTLPKIVDNLKLLARYPFHKKISCVVTREHMRSLNQFADDIRYLHYELGLDMSRFNIMFGFDGPRSMARQSAKAAGTEMLSGDEQLRLYRFLYEEFSGTELEYGLRKHWFKEFTPDFCCSAVNCGDKFFLLQSNGDVYSCPRGQSSHYFKYGNLFENSIRSILQSGWRTIESLEQAQAGDDDCYTCEFLPYCHQGCVYVRKETGLRKSYTCNLQKAIYRDNPELYKPFDIDYIHRYSLRYRYRNNIQSIPLKDVTPEKTSYVTPELHDVNNALSNIIARDKTLGALYSSDHFQLSVDNEIYPMRSPILINRREIAVISAKSRVQLRIDTTIFSENCRETVNNFLHVMLLRDTAVRYGDEGRLKQEHIADYCVFCNSVIELSNEVPGGTRRSLDLTSFLNLHRDLFLEGTRNILYVTTKTLRDYHYQKQKDNAFYHIQAINLPFPYLEFYWFTS